LPDNHLKWISEQKWLMDDIAAANQFSSALFEVGTRINDLIPEHDDVLNIDDEIAEILVTSEYTLYQRLMQIIKWLTQPGKKYIARPIYSILLYHLEIAYQTIWVAIFTSVGFCTWSYVQNCTYSIPVGRPGISEVEKNNSIDFTRSLPNNLNHAVITKRTRVRKSGRNNSKEIVQLNTGSFVWVVKEGKWLKVLFAHPKTDELMFGYMRNMNIEYTSTDTFNYKEK